MKKEIALNIIKDALDEFSDDFHFSSVSPPYAISLNGEKYYFTLGETHFAEREDEDECRIQLNKNMRLLYLEKFRNGENVVILGFNVKRTIFSAWEAAHVFNRTSGNVSIYSRFSLLDEAKTYVFVPYSFKSKILKRNSLCFNFRPHLLGPYLQIYQVLHTLKESQIRKISFANIREETEREEKGVIYKKKLKLNNKRHVITRKQLYRDPNFREYVVNAYGRKCCVCSTSLEIIEAAHIIPHSDPDSPNTLENGLALCPNHHKLFDSGLLIIDPAYRIGVNPVRKKYLTKIGQTKGIEDLRQFEGKNICVPEEKNSKPNPEFLEKRQKLQRFEE